MSDKALSFNVGGQFTAAAAAGAPGAVALSTAPGRLCRVIPTSSGSVATSIYDNASAASGTILFTIPATPTVGTIYDVQMPVSNGIFCGGATNTSAVTISYTTDTPFGR